jgi:hypothetical protein
MRGEKLFKEHYEPKLAENGIDNVVLRVYTHIQGLRTDDPENSTQLIFSPTKEVDKRLNEIFYHDGEQRGVAITSIISVNAKERRLFLLDCGLPVTPENKTELISLLSKKPLKALEKSMLLQTQNSYHIIGFVPLSIEEWYEHMAQAILMRTASGVTVPDIRYIGHSLERGYGSLRLTDYKNKPTPDFICYGHESR